MAQIIWSEKARKDLKEIVDYIAQDKPSTASLFGEKIYEAAGRLKQFPKSGHVVLEMSALREIIYGNYRIIYRILADDSVEIATIHHSARILHIT
jgi:addiction module RelE/StbE family toxin